MREEGEPCIGQRAQHRAQRKDPAGVITVGQAGEGESEGADDEPQLDSVGQQADPGNADVPGARQIIGGAVRTEPQGRAEQLRHDDDGNRHCDVRPGASSSRRTVLAG